MAEKLQLLAEGLTEGSEYFLDGITIREVLPTGELGPNLITVTDDSEGWESNKQLEPIEGNGS